MSLNNEKKLFQRFEQIRSGKLTNEEKRVVKALLKNGFSENDIHLLVNYNRREIIDLDQIVAIDKDTKQEVADAEEIDSYESKKCSYDPQIGLNLHDEERLIRAREAMIVAVEIFNSSTLQFKLEIFSVLANIAWTYVLHEYYERQGAKVVSSTGRTMLLSRMIRRGDCPLSEGVRNNIEAIIKIRDKVEHKLFGRGDSVFQSLFQACCLNFNEFLCSQFGSNLSLSREFPFVLFFSRINFEQLSILNRYDIPASIQALDAELENNLTEDQRNDLEYRFRVVYTLGSSSKSKANFSFIRPESAEGKEITQVLVRDRISDEIYPHKPKQVCKLVETQTGLSFTSHNHTQAWRYYNVRPRLNNAQPENTNKDYCIFHPAFKSYTYSDKWVDLLVELVSNQNEFDELKKTRIY